MSTPAELVIARLTETLGPQAARSTLNTFCKRTVGVQPDALSAAQLKLVLPSLKSLLSVLVGVARAEAIIVTLERDL
jgi:hypothetical protein